MAIRSDGEKLGFSVEALRRWVSQAERDAGFYDERILRIVVNTDRDRDGLMGAIGHELQHAWEVLRVPGVTTTQAMFFNAVALGPTATFPIRFETDEAVKAGVRIEREVRRGRAEH